MAVIPYLGTTLPPIATMVKYFGPQGDASQETTIPFAGKTLQINKVLAANATELGAKLPPRATPAISVTWEGSALASAGQARPSRFPCTNSARRLTLTKTAGRTAIGTR